MPKYELMYIVASTVSDDQIPALTDGVLNLVKENGGTIVSEEKLGKKKLAYPIKKTRNGFYALVTFEMEPKTVGELDTKVLNTDGIIRHIIVNIEEQLERAEKDRVAQEKMNRSRAASAATRKDPVASDAPPITDEKLEEKIEEALSEDLSNA